MMRFSFNFKFYFSNYHILQILHDFNVLFTSINGKSLEQKWDDLHDKPLSEFKDKIDTNKIPTTNVEVWQLITTIMALKTRGNFWNGLSSLIIFSAV